MDGMLSVFLWAYFDRLREQLRVRRRKKVVRNRYACLCIGVATFIELIEVSGKHPKITLFVLLVEYPLIGIFYGALRQAQGSTVETLS